MSRAVVPLRAFIERLEDRSLPAVAVFSFVNSQGITEHRLLQDGFHLGTVVYPPDRAAAFRPRPDLNDPNGFGTSFQLAPFLGGGDAVSDPPGVTADNAAGTFTIIVSGRVNRTPTTTYGTWNETLTVAFDPVTQTISGSGTLFVTLDGTLTAAAADLNVGRIKSNYLDDVPLLPSGTGDTGDMRFVNVTYSPVPGPPNFTWVPTDGTTFPTDTSATLGLDMAGNLNRVNTAAQGFAPIAVARKPGFAATYTAMNPAHALSAGLVYTAALSQDAFADNVAAVPLLLRATTNDTSLQYTLALSSTPIDVVRPRAGLAAGGKADELALYGLAPGATQYPAVATPATPLGAIGTNLRPAVGDVNGDTIPDTILVTGPGVPIRVTVLSGADNATVLVAPFDPFGGNFTGGGFVAAGDIDGDGRAEFVVSPDQGGGPRVSIYTLKPDGSTDRRANFFGIDDENFRGGARVSVGDINGDGAPDLAVAAGFLGGPRVALFSGTSLFGTPARLVGDFFGFPGPDAMTLRNGAYVGVGDVDGDGKAELILGAGPGGAPRVFVLSGARLTAGDVAGAQAAPVGNFFVDGDTTDRGGVRVASHEVDTDTRAEVVTGSGENRPARARVYFGKTFGGSNEPGGFQNLDPFGMSVLTGGVFVG